MRFKYNPIESIYAIFDLTGTVAKYGRLGPLAGPRSCGPSIPVQRSDKLSYTVELPRCSSKFTHMYIFGCAGFDEVNLKDSLERCIGIAGPQVRFLAENLVFLFLQLFLVRTKIVYVCSLGLTFNLCVSFQSDEMQKKIVQVAIVTVYYE